jgi:hypothetical protein
LTYRCCLAESWGRLGRIRDNRFEQFLDIEADPIL